MSVTTCGVDVNLTTRDLSISRQRRWAPSPLAGEGWGEGSGSSIELNPSPGSHLAMRSDLSRKGRGEERPSLLAERAHQLIAQGLDQVRQQRALAGLHEGLHRHARN